MGQGGRVVNGDLAVAMTATSIGIQRAVLLLLLLLPVQFVVVVIFRLLDSLLDRAQL